MLILKFLFTVSHSQSFVIFFPKHTLFSSDGHSIPFS